MALGAVLRISIAAVLEVCGVELSVWPLRKSACVNGDCDAGLLAGHHFLTAAEMEYADLPSGSSMAVRPDARRFTPELLFGFNPPWVPSHREFDLAVGKLPPIFNDRLVSAGRIGIENLARLEARNLQRQRKGFAQKVIILYLAQVAQIARPAGQIPWTFHSIKL
jgi:hypothetical protein